MESNVDSGKILRLALVAETLHKSQTSTRYILDRASKTRDLHAIL